MNKKIPNISEEFLKEYYEKARLRNELNNEVSTMSKRIKHEMAKVGRKEIQLYGYTIDVETKVEPNEDFFNLIYKNKLEYLITPSISGNHLKSARRQMKMSDDTYYDKYVREKETKWLYVRKGKLL